ncbi:MAG: hypothetical protein EOM67_14420 [Spirochaetia bacterium]|nr:hypothetical protein [Spirochaetia bacterium]
MRWEVSIVGADTVKYIEETVFKGLCMDKFKADFIVDNIDFSHLVVGDIIPINSRSLVIDQVGKGCYEGCVLHDKNLYCPLRNGCAFGHWLQKK